MIKNNSPIYYIAVLQYVHQNAFITIKLNKKKRLDIGHPN